MLVEIFDGHEEVLISAKPAALIIISPTSPTPQSFEESSRFTMSSCTFCMLFPAGTILPKPIQRIRILDAAIDLVVRNTSACLVVPSAAQISALGAGCGAQRSLS
jgi:hypothetical protein